MRYYKFSSFSSSKTKHVNNEKINIHKNISNKKSKKIKIKQANTVEKQVSSDE